MRRMRIAGVVMAGLMLMLWVRGSARAGVEDSKHDFSNTAWSAGDACGACHTPHRAQAPKAAPLWNRGADLSRRFGSSTVAGRQTPGNGTLMCMRCHDGTVARDTISGTKRSRFKNKKNAAFFRTGHGSTDHPVGIEYPLFEKGYRPKTAVLARGTVRLPNGQVECVSCHDPHDTSGEKKMLVMGNDGSRLCLTCHSK